MNTQRNQSATASFYSRTDLFGAIVRTLAAAGIARENITRRELAAIDEFHVRGQEVSQELARAASLQPGMRILDVGCGLGGPCRMFAAEYGCIATGIDITAEYVQTAARLSALTGLSGSTHFVHGDALSLPFANAQFDMVWTQHVQMNIAGKQRFYAEIERVLVRGGQFIYYDVFSTGSAALHFPVPWAHEPSLSHLVTRHTLHDLLHAAGLRPVRCTNETEQGIQFLETLLRRIDKRGFPPLGLHLLMGDTAHEKLKNLLINLIDGKIVLESGHWKK